MRFDDSAPRRSEDRAQLAAMLRSVGGSRMEFRAELAGPFGCDPCWDCRRRPAKGEVVWQNCYGDLYCDGCAARRRLEATA